jgi:hypothetical protein
MFHTYVTSVLYGYCVYLQSVFQVFLHVCFKCFICLFFILQMFHLNISKVDRDVAHGMRVRSRRRREWSLRGLVARTTSGAK